MPNRTVCAMLEEVRKCHETRNYSYLLGLVEEIQSAANKMEAKLWDQSDYKYKMEELKNARKELKDIKEKINEAK